MALTQPAHIQSFGRRRGRKLRANRSALMETLLPKLLIPVDGFEPESLFPNPHAPLWFELGFGGGEHLVEQARRHRDVNFIGCEPYINGMASLLSMIDTDKLLNIRLFSGDARLVLERLPDACLARLFVLFPDPWPKARHHKRRIISQATLQLFHVKLSPGGLLRLATDHVEYAVWMREHLEAFGGFKPAGPGAGKTPPADWVPTRYQAKAEAEGRKAIFLEWLKP